VDGQGLARIDHQAEDNTQAHHWRRLWHLTEYNKLQTVALAREDNTHPKRKLMTCPYNTKSKYSIWSNLVTILFI